MGEKKITKMSWSLRKLELQFQFAKYVLLSVSILGALGMIMYFSYQIAINSPEQFAFLAKIFEALRIYHILGYLTAGIAIVAWRAERAGKKRAIKKASKYQHLCEKDDPQRSSSGLTETGDTPRDEE